jgi:hypothetical protein
MMASSDDSTIAANHAASSGGCGDKRVLETGQVGAVELARPASRVHHALARSQTPRQSPQLVKSDGNEAMNSRTLAIWLFSEMNS